MPPFVFPSSSVRIPQESTKYRVYRWEHTDPELFAKDRGSRAIDRAKSMTWDNSFESVTDLRSLLFYTHLVRAGLSNTHNVITNELVTGPAVLSLSDPSPSEGQFALTIHDDPPFGFSSEERLQASETLLRSIFALAHVQNKGKPFPLPDTIVRTREGFPGNAVTDVSGYNIAPIYTLVSPQLVAGIVLGLGAIAASAYVAMNSFEIIQYQLLRMENSRRLAKYWAESLRILAEHKKAEEKAGKELPFSESEKRGLAQSEKMQAIILKKKETPSPGPTPASSLSLLALAGLGAVGVYFYSQTKQRGS